MRILSGYVKPIMALAVTPDGKRLFSTAEGQSKTWEWDLATGAVSRKLDVSGAALAMAPAGDYLITADGVWICYHPLADGDRPRQLNVRNLDWSSLGESADVAIHPPRRLIAATYCNSSGTVRGYRTWEPDTDATVVRGGHEGSVTAVAFSPAG